MWRLKKEHRTQIYFFRGAVLTLVEALQSRLKVLEDETLRLTKLASGAVDKAEQDSYWCFAQDLQREARDLRSQIRKISEPQPRTPSVGQTGLL
jgi:hypothetical protein